MAKKTAEAEGREATSRAIKKKRGKPRETEQNCTKLRGEGICKKRHCYRRSLFFLHKRLWSRVSQSTQQSITDEKTVFCPVETRNSCCRFSPGIVRKKQATTWYNVTLEIICFIYNQEVYLSGTISYALFLIRPTKLFVSMHNMCLCEARVWLFSTATS